MTVYNPLFYFLLNQSILTLTLLLEKWGGQRVLASWTWSQALWTRASRNLTSESELSSSARVGALRSLFRCTGTCCAAFNPFSFVCDVKPPFTTDDSAVCFGESGVVTSGKRKKEAFLELRKVISGQNTLPQVPALRNTHQWHSISMSHIQSTDAWYTYVYKTFLLDNTCQIQLKKTFNWLMIYSHL